MPIQQDSADYFASELAKRNYERMKQAQDEGEFNTIKVPEVPCANCGTNTFDLGLAGVTIEMDGFTFCCAGCLEEWMDNQPQRQAACQHEYESKNAGSPMEPSETIGVCKYCGHVPGEQP